ncbi:hypothetical protein LBMAG56_40760 [Verrucomicrobiota bacterium]|nr:hypothetical protein LBMAG56_40760 [Verrucomicrobiota bacterium]
MAGVPALAALMGDAPCAVLARVNAVTNAAATAGNKFRVLIGDAPGGAATNASRLGRAGAELRDAASGCRRK